MAAVSKDDLRQWQARATTSVFLISGLAGSIFIAILLKDSSFFDGVMRLADRIQLGTLTGRTNIWAETFRAASNNWIFGYGPGLWDLAFRIKVGLPFTHAHNQFIHVFGAAGVVGLIALLAYLVALARFSWHTRTASKDVSLVLFMYLLLRGFTELPMNISNAMQGEFIVQLFLLVVCIGSVQISVARVAASGPKIRDVERKPKSGTGVLV